jgi:hypothetical protein
LEAGLMRALALDFLSGMMKSSTAVAETTSWRRHSRMKLRGIERGKLANARCLGEHLVCSPCGEWRSMRVERQIWPARRCCCRTC